MVRTKAGTSSAAVRKAVGAKAPRKSLPSSTSALSPSGGANKKKVKGVGGNPLKIWPAPKWQKNLHAFLGVEQPDSSSSSADGASSSSSSSFQESRVTVDEQLAGTSSGSGSSCQGSSSSVVSGIELLSGDIAQMNSDDDE